jgi:hypothetical protein
MSVRLAVLQFPLLFCFPVMIALSVVGANFNSPVGYIYLIPLLLAPLLLPRLGQRPRAWLRRHARVLAAAGVLLGGLAYRPIHLAHWDGQSPVQALAVSAFGLVSAVVSWLAAGEASEGQSDGFWQTAAALAIVAVLFLTVRWYFLIPLLGAALFLAPAVTLRWEPVEPGFARSTARPLFANAFAFYLAAELGDVVWDFGVDPSWGPQIALTCVVASAVALARGLTGRRAATTAASRPWFTPTEGALVLAVTGAVSIATALYPVFILSPLRQAVLGLALGGLIVAVLARVLGAADGAGASMGVWLWFTLGLAVSNLYSAQLLAYPAGRLAFAVPAVVALLLERRGTRNAAAPGAGQSP